MFIYTKQKTNKKQQTKNKNKINSSQVQIVETELAANGHNNLVSVYLMQGKLATYLTENMNKGLLYSLYNKNKNIRCIFFIGDHAWSSSDEDGNYLGIVRLLRNPIPKKIFSCLCQMYRAIKNRISKTSITGAQQNKNWGFV